MRGTTIFLRYFNRMRQQKRFDFLFYSSIGSSPTLAKRIKLLSTPWPYLVTLPTARFASHLFGQNGFPAQTIRIEYIRFWTFNRQTITRKAKRNERRRTRRESMNFRTQRTLKGIVYECHWREQTARNGVLPRASCLAVCLKYLITLYLIQFHQ